ncbi:YfbM family protein [Paenibacillus hunanensis]|uniref:YfbM family protein n=1 Tax=Paenibacillus hunanensis TaxID=539262 RepID=UPI002A6AA0F0|nr:YfbM family protein [Paenibacillus hunanensis]WPP40065.1 YfbM family protein [Paenibacillus hunanensis]
MGMIGGYLAVDRTLVEQLAQGKRNLEDIDLEDFSGLDIDKSWQALHFMLCGELVDGAPPKGYVVPMISGQFLEFGEYGAFYLFPEQVQEASRFLESLTEEELKSMYDFDVLVKEEIYPIYAGDQADEFFEYIAEYLKQIKTLYATMVRKEQGVIFYIA